MISVYCDKCPNTPKINLNIKVYEDHAIVECENCGDTLVIKNNDALVSDVDEEKNDVNEENSEVKG